MSWTANYPTPLQGFGYILLTGIASLKFFPADQTMPDYFHIYLILYQAVL
jgi:hypothetical protein